MNKIYIFILLILILLPIYIVAAGTELSTTTAIIKTTTTLKPTTTSTTSTTLLNQDLFSSKNLTVQDKITLQSSIKQDVESRYKVSVSSVNLQPIISFKLLNNNFVVTQITLTNGKKVLLISNKDIYISKYINKITTERTEALK